jgi:hypothetical protein
MRKSTIIMVACFAALALTVQSALAVSVHWKKGSPQFVDNGLTLTESGTLAGLGTSGLQITLSATANPTATCTNPGNGVHQPAGQNPASVNVTGSVSIPAGAVKHGNANYTVTTDPPTSPVAGAPECPNSSWTEDITDMAFTSASINVTQGGVTVFDASKSTCTFDPATSDGAVTSFSC